MASSGTSEPDRSAPAACKGCKGSFAQEDVVAIAGGCGCGGTQEDVAAAATVCVGVQGVGGQSGGLGVSQLQQECGRAGALPDCQQAGPRHADPSGRQQRALTHHPSPVLWPAHRPSPWSGHQVDPMPVPPRHRSGPLAVPPSAPAPACGARCWLPCRPLPPPVAPTCQKHPPASPAWPAATPPGRRRAPQGPAPTTTARLPTTNADLDP